MGSIAINQPRLSYYVGGAEMIAIQHAQIMLELGHHVTVFTINPESIQTKCSGQYINFKKKFGNKINFCEVNQDHRAKYIYTIPAGENRDRWNIESFFYNRALSRIMQIDAKCYDAMLSYFNLDALSVSSQFVSNNALYLCGIPKEDNLFRSGFLAMYDTIIAITDDTQRYWQKYTDKTIAVIPTGVDYKRFLPAQKHSKIFKIGFMGRLVKRKGCDNFIKSIFKIPNHILDNIEFQIIGDGPQVDSLKKIASRLPTHHRPKFIGIVDNPEYYLSQMNVCVFPSQFGEGLQGALLEAMSSGVTVVASNTNVNIKLLDKGRGILIDPDNIDDISDKICKLALNKSACHEIGIKAREFIIRNYAWSNVGKSIEKSLL